MPKRLNRMSGQIPSGRIMPMHKKPGDRTQAERGKALNAGAFTAETGCM
jgi:hypothetical protein